MKNILCFLGLHKYKIIYAKGNRIVKRCTRCNHTISSCYDMCYGGSYWVKGNLYKNALAECPLRRVK